MGPLAGGHSIMLALAGAGFEAATQAQPQRRTRMSGLARPIDLRALPSVGREAAMCLVPRCAVTGLAQRPLESTGLLVGVSVA